MSLNEFKGTMSPERIQFLLDEYDIAPEVIKQRRAFLGRAWYGLGFEKPVDETKSDITILHEAIEGARRFDAGEVEGILNDRSPIIQVSEIDLEKIQSASNLSIHANHQKYWDIPYLAQMLRELIGTDSTSHFIMKKGVPFPGYFKSAGGIIVLRGKDLKYQKIKNDRRKKLGLPTKDIEKERPELIRPKDLPDFQHHFTQKPSRNTIIFDKGTRNSDSFVYEEKVIDQVQRGINATLHTTHVFVGINYEGNKPVMQIKVLTEDEMRDGDLGNTVNVFLDGVKNSSN